MARIGLGFLATVAAGPKVWSTSAWSRSLATQARGPEDLAQALGLARSDRVVAGPGRAAPRGPGNGRASTLSFRRPGSLGQTAMTNCQPGLCAAMMG